MTDASERVQFLTESLGGSALSRLIQDGGAPDGWVTPRPASPEEWRARADEVRASTTGDWAGLLSSAASPHGAARERLTRVAKAGGAVVTTGQQPGLFGGPIYTWSKAVSALALADCIEATTGLPMVPIFWAATDDADFLEAADTWVAVPGGAERLALSGSPEDGVPLSRVPLGDVSGLRDTLARACGSVADARPLNAAGRAYADGVTVGDAYVTLLRALLEPLGIVVLDASHEAVSMAAHPLLTRALERWTAVDEALREREAELLGQGLAPQVELVAGRTLVFDRSAGRRVRVPHDRAHASLAAAPGTLSPNVLLRPVVERSLLPTLAYSAGPGELAYAAQVSAVAQALGAATPLAVPRWSVTIIEPHVAALLERYGVSPRDLAHADALESRLAREAWPATVAYEFGLLRDTLRRGTAALRREILSGDSALVPPGVMDGVERQMAWRMERLERRITAGVKRQSRQLMHDLGTLRGAFYPGGNRQERALNIIPLLARHGLTMLDGMRAAAGEHAMAQVRGETVAPMRP